MNSRNTDEDRSLQEAVYDEFAAVVKALANGKRLELLELIGQGEITVDRLARLTGHGMSTVSTSLKELRSAGLVKTRRVGTTVRYRVANPEVIGLFRLLRRVALAQSPALRHAVADYQHSVSPDDVAVIDLQTALDEAYIVDLRSPDEFAVGHLPQAICIPFEELHGQRSRLPTDQTIALYCRGPFCRDARDGAQLLTEMGYTTAILHDAIIDWRDEWDDLVEADLDDRP